MAKKNWTYSTGDKGRNRVRAYEEAKSGKIFLEYFPKVDGRSKRERISTGHSNREKAQQQAQEFAAELGRMKPQEEAAELTLRKLFEIYLGEKTPQKSEGKQKHDRRAAEMFVSYFGESRKVSSLLKRDGERFIADRREGNLPGRGTVGNRTVEYDLRFLKAVLNWALDNEMIAKNPWRALRLPKEQSPKRPVLTKSEYERLVESSTDVGGWRFRVALVLAYETGHRGKAVRHLRWSDVDLEARAVHWRAENDKSEREHVTPLSEGAIEALREAQKEQMAIGGAWVLPSPSDRSQPCSRHLLRDWWERGVKAAGLDEVEGRGWHSLRRLFATRMKDQPMVTLMKLGGWKDQETVLKCYQTADFEEMEMALRAG